MTSKEAAVKPQDVPAPKTVNRTTFILTIALTFFTTLVVATVFGSGASTGSSGVATVFI